MAANLPPLAWLQQQVQNILEPELRENSIRTLAEAYKQAEDLHHQLAPLLWHSRGIVTALLQEIIPVYLLVDPPLLTAVQSTRAYDTIILFKCLASNGETRLPFLLAGVPGCLAPFVESSVISDPLDYLRLGTMRVFGRLAEGDEEVIAELLQKGTVELSARAVWNGNDSCKTDAIYVIKRVLSTVIGLEYVCSRDERYFLVERVLEAVVRSPVGTSPRMLNHIIEAYLSLTYDQRALARLRHSFPYELRDYGFYATVHNDARAMGRRQHLLTRIGPAYPMV